MKTRIKFVLLSLLALTALSSAAQGTIKGTVKTNGGAAPGVLVTVEDGSSYQEFSETDINGYFRFANVPSGTYSLSFTSPGLETYVETGVRISAGATAELSISLIAPLNVMEVMTVASASRRTERIVEAPAAVSVITQKEIEAQAAHGQLPRILESTPGVELAQAGVFDFNINARGFNSSLNRRILVLIDGRETATGFLGNQEWSALSFPLEEISGMELVRGPGSALYGANAFNGVLNITSKRPLDSLGGKISISGGTLSSRRIDFRYADTFGEGWSYRVNAGTFASETWSQSRTVSEQGRDSGGNLIPGLFEYANLGTAEITRLDEDDITSVYGGARLDKEFNGGQVFSAEVGFANVENALAVTGLGRVQIDESERPWLRLNFNDRHYNIMYTNGRRETPIGQTSLGTSNLLWEDSEIQHLEFQANYDFMDGRLKMVGGAAYTEEDVDTRDPMGNHTLMKEAKNEDQQAIFGQLKFEATEKLDLILAGRWDDSSLHESQESPKAAIVYKFNQNHSLRGTYNEAFQTANYSEIFLRAASADIIPFGLIQDAVVLGGFGLDLRNVGQDGQPLGPNNGPALLDWQNIPAVAAGNPNLVPEENESWELGYKGIIGSKLFLTVDYYQSEIVNFITDLLPGVNPDYTGFVIQENLPAEVSAALMATINGALGPIIASGLANQTIDINPSGLSPALDGHPVVVVSYTNAGQVDTEGFDVAFNYYFNDEWTLDGNYSWFDFDVKDQLVGDQLIPNSSENKFNLGLSFNREGWSASVKYHYVEGFPWAAGVFQGVIPDYDTFNLTLGYQLDDHWRFGFVGNNMADDKHYEIFGGSINERRMLVSINYGF